MTSNIGNIINSPCKKCDKRKNNCHSNCREFKKYNFIKLYYRNKLEKEANKRSVAYLTAPRYYRGKKAKLKCI